MNQDLGLRILSQILDWPDEHARKEFDWLRLMARLKYDGYRDFQAGMRFIESLAVADREHNSPGPITSVDSGPHWLRISAAAGPHCVRTGPH